jgi:osmotically-inducible protein OsmY
LINKQTLTTAIVLASLLLAGCQSYVDGSKRTPGEVTDDAQIKVAVKLKLLDDPEVAGTKIGVSVNRGIVTLSGRVPSDYAREKAHRLSSEVRGVRSTVDKLTLVE